MLRRVLVRFSMQARRPRLGAGRRNRWLSHPPLAVKAIYPCPNWSKARYWPRSRRGIWRMAAKLNPLVEGTPPMVG